MSHPRRMIEHMFGSVDLEALVEVCLKAAGVDARLCPDDELTGAATALESARRALDAASVHVLAELESRKVCDRVHGLPTSRWVEHRTCGSNTDARVRIRTGERLVRWFPVLDGALADGEVSFAHVELVCRLATPRIADRLSVFDADLVDLARSCGFDRFAAEVRAIAALLDGDGGHDPRLRPSELDLAATPDGCRLQGDLDEHDALVATTALDAIVDELRLGFLRERDEGVPVEVPSLRQLRAMALVELCRRGRAFDAERCAGPVPDVTLVVHEERGGEVRTERGQRVSEAVAELLLCDASFATLLVDGDGTPLRLGRSRRRASGPQRRALAHRDRGCIFPGCGAGASWCDAHHVTHWRGGGRTDIENLALLCRYHHGVVHRRGWAMTAVGDQAFTVTTPDGTALRTRRHPPPGSAAPRSEHLRE